MSTGLLQLGIAELRALLAAVEQGRVETPLTATGLRATGFGPWIDDVLPLVGDAKRAGVLAMLRATLAERENHRSPRLELVWTGPVGPHGTVRDTAVVVRQLFAQARDSVLIGGFRFDAGADLFEPLRQVMADHGVTATIFLDVEGVAKTVAGGPAYAAKRVAEFYTKNWPFDGPRPEVYYDPRTAVPGPPWVSLHAKYVVVDERWSLVTSANFTDRGQSRNIEAGVLIDDEHFARRLATQWRGLIANGVVQRYRG